MIMCSFLGWIFFSLLRAECYYLVKITSHARSTNHDDGSCIDPMSRLRNNPSRAAGGGGGGGH